MKVFPLLRAVQVTNFPAGGIYLLFVDNLNATSVT